MSEATMVSSNTLARGAYNEIVDSTSSQVGKLLLNFFEVDNTEVMRDTLQTISSLIETKVQQIGTNVDTIAPHYQEYLSTARNQNINQESKIVTLNSLVYCDVVLGLFQQFSDLARGNHLNECRHLTSLDSIRDHFSPLLSLVVYVVVAVAMETPNDESVRQYFDLLPLEPGLAPRSYDGFRPRQLPPLLSWINGGPHNSSTMARQDGFVFGPCNLDIDQVVKWPYVIALLTGYHDTRHPNRCFTSNHGYFRVPRVPALAKMLNTILNAKASGRQLYARSETAKLYQQIMSPWNKFAPPAVLAQAYGQNVFRKLKSMASEGFFDELACAKVPDWFKENPEVTATWAEKPSIKMWKFLPEDGIPFYLIVGENIFSSRFHQWRERCANLRPVLPAAGGSKGGFISVSVRGARTVDDDSTFDEELQATYFPVGNENSRAVHLYGACPHIQPDDDDLFRITDLIYSTCDEGISEYMDENSKDAKRFPTGKANIISTFYASGNNIGQGSHTDFNLTIAREKTESFDDVPLPTREELFTLTYVAVQSRYVENPATHTTYKYTSGGKTLSPVKNEPNCENGSVVITGNGFALQGSESQLAKHGVELVGDISEVPSDTNRSASTCRRQSMPKAIMKKLKGHSVYRFLPPSFEERMAKWERDSAGFEKVYHSGYMTYDCGNAKALVSADPKASDSGSHMDYFSHQKGLAPLPNMECDNQVGKSPIAPSQLTDAWKKVSSDKLPSAPDPFGYDNDITRQEFFINSKFPASIGMLHHTVVRNLLLRHGVNVKFECLPQRLRGPDTSDSEMSSCPKLISPQLYMPEENCFAKPGEIYCKKAVRLAAGMPDKPGSRSHPIISCLIHKPAILILRNPYKSTPAIKGMAMNSLRMRKAKWMGLSTTRLEDDGITYGSGGSSLPSKSNQCQVADLALDVHNIQAALTLTLGQLGNNKINDELQKLMRLGFPISLFVTLGEFFSKDDLREIYELLQEIAEGEGDQQLGDWEEFLSSASDRVLFIDYIFLKEVRLTVGADPTQREDLSGNGVTGNTEREDLSGEDKLGSGLHCLWNREGTQQREGESLTKLDNQCIVSPGTESDHEKHGVLVDFKNNFHHLLVMSRIFSPAETQKLCVISGTPTPMKEVVVDKDDSSLFKIPVSFDTAYSISRGRATFSVHNMRRYLFTEGYRKYIVDETGMNATLTDDDNDDDEEARAFNNEQELVEERLQGVNSNDNGDNIEGEESNGAGEASTGNQNARVEIQTSDRPDLPDLPDQDGSVPLEKAIREVIFSCAMTIQAGCLRALGKSVVQQMVVSHNNNRTTPSLASSTLSAPHVIDVCRLHPMPMAARYLDVGPLCSIAHSISFEGMKPTKSFVFPGQPSNPRYPKFIRIPVDESSLASLYSEDRATLITNACIMRFTGRPNYLMGYANLDDANGEQPSTASVLAGLLLASSPVDRKRFIQFIRAVSKPNSRGYRIVGHLFSKAHLKQIPDFLQQSLENFLFALENGFFDIGKEFLENYHRIINEVKESGSYKEGDENYFHAVQNKVFQWLVSYLHEKCDGNGRTKEKDWHFLAQSLLLDIRGALLFPSLETHYLRSSPTGLILEGNANDDPNKTCSNPEIISMGNGSSAVLKLLRKRTNRPGLSMGDAFKMTLVVLRDMSDAELLTVGLVTLKSGDRKVLIDALTGQVWCRLGFEHWLCKHYLVLKHKFPQNGSSKNPDTDKPYLHPWVWGSSRTNLRMVDWDKHVPEFFELARSIVGVFGVTSPVTPFTGDVYPNFGTSGANNELAYYDAYSIACRKTENRRKQYWPVEFIESLKINHKHVISRKWGAKKWSLAKEGSNGQWSGGVFRTGRAVDLDLGYSDVDESNESESNTYTDSFVDMDIELGHSDGGESNGGESNKDTDSAVDMDTDQFDEDPDATAELSDDSTVQFSARFWGNSSKRNPFIDKDEDDSWDEPPKGKRNKTI